MFSDLWRRATRVVSVALAAAVGLAMIVPPGAIAVSASAGEQITGKVAATSMTYFADADISAVAFQFIDDPASTTVPPAKAWVAVSDAPVAADGTYAIDLQDAGTYRVGFFDSQNVFADRYYLQASKVESGTDVPVASGQVVANVDDTLTALPENILEGKVGFTGETAPTDGVGVTVYSYDTTTGVASALMTKRTAADGTWRIHLPAKDVPSGFTGTYRVGASDFDDVFAPAYFDGASKVESATALDMNVAHLQSGVDVTMTAQPSSWTTAKDTYGLAINLSKRFEDGFAGTVVVASASSWQDMLVAAPFSHAVGGPLLATGKALPARTVVEITRLAPAQVVIVGGTGAVSLTQEFQLRALGVPVVRRIAGHNSAETAVQVADEMINNGLAGEGVCVAPLETAAPSLANAALAVGTDQPIVFTNRTTVPGATMAFINRRAISQTLVFGGGSYIVSSAYKKFPGRVQLSGPTYAGVATKGSQYGISSLDLGGRIVGLVSTVKPVDAFVADTFFGSKRITAVATGPKTCDATTKSYLTANKANFARVMAVGSAGTFTNAAYSAAVSAVK